MNTSREQKRRANKVGKSPRIDFPDSRIIMVSSAGLWRWRGPQISFIIFLSRKRFFGSLNRLCGLVSHNAPRQIDRENEFDIKVTFWLWLGLLMVEKKMKKSSESSTA
jgi:hypothetical protein